MLLIVSNNRSKRSIQKLIKLKSFVTHLYQDYKIPITWMLDSGIMSKIKQVSRSLVKMYMKRVTMELESIKNSDRESSQESLLLQGVHVTYRAHETNKLSNNTLVGYREIDLLEFLTQDSDFDVEAFSLLDPSSPGKVVGSISISCSVEVYG